MNEKRIFVVILTFATLVMGLFVAKDIAQKNGLVFRGEKGWQWNNEWDQVDEDVQSISEEKREDQLVAKNYQEAIEMSKKHGKNILIFFGADWCDFCERMKSNTFPKDSVKNKMVKYIFVDIDVDSNKRLARQYKVNGLPTYVIATANEEVVKRGSGYKGEKAFGDWLD